MRVQKYGRVINIAWDDDAGLHSCLIYASFFCQRGATVCLLFLECNRSWQFRWRREVMNFLLPFTNQAPLSLPYSPCSYLKNNQRRWVDGILVCHLGKKTIYRLARPRDLLNYSKELYDFPAKWGVLAGQVDFPKKIHLTAAVIPLWILSVNKGANF